MNRLARNYDRLTGDERFRLAIAALAREDDPEAAKLGSTCPSFTYRLKDWEFYGRMSALDKIMMALALELTPHLHLIRFLDTQEPLTDTVFEILEQRAVRSWATGYQARGGDRKALEAFSDDPEAKPSDLERSVLGAAMDAHEITLRLRQHWSRVREVEFQTMATVLAGFDTFARETWGMSGAEAIKAHGDIFEDMGPYQAEIQDAPVDDELVKAGVVGFKRLWRTLMHQEHGTGSPERVL